ncbi:hypothetical protein RYX36_014158, partial [Vicia faba]
VAPICLNHNWSDKRCIRKTIRSSYDFTNENSNLKGKAPPPALMSDAKFNAADMTEVVMSKAYAVRDNFK